MDAGHTSLGQLNVCLFAADEPGRKLSQVRLVAHERDSVQR